MPRRKRSEEQIVYALRQVEAGTKIGEVCRQLGVSEQTYFRWKKQYAGLGLPELRRLKQLEEENATQAPGRGPEPRQAHASGGYRKKL